MRHHTGRTAPPAKCDGGLKLNLLDTRDVARERMLMFAKLMLANTSEHRVRIRDLSAQGVQAEGDVGTQPGEQVDVDFGAAGKAAAVVAWCDGAVIGLKFDQEIEPELVRRAISGRDERAYHPPWYVRVLGRERHTLGPPRKV